MSVQQPAKLRFNLTGWLGFILFAGIGFTLYVYTFLPTNNCYVTPLYCLAIVHVYYFPFAVTGFFVFSHLFGVRNLRIYALLLLLLGAGVFLGVKPVQGQPVPVFIQVIDYYPYTFWVDAPKNVSYTTTVLDEYYVFQWAYFWPYHPVSLPSTCAPAIPTVDWELVYVYVSVASQQTVGIAYRYHCNWTFVSSADPGGVIAVNAPGVYSLNATRPVVSFLTRYHVPINDYPGGLVRGVTFATRCIPDCQGAFAYQQQDYNFTFIPQLPVDSAPIDPTFFQNKNWINIETFTIAGFIIWAVTWVIFFAERKKLT